MKSTDHLFKLIRSLSGRERAYALRYFQAQSETGSKLYVQLFHALGAQSEYDESAILEEFSINRKKLASTKYYLQNVLLAAMRQRYWEEQVDSELWAACLDAELLADKGLYDLAQKQLKKAEVLNGISPSPFYTVRLFEIRSKLNPRDQPNEGDLPHRLQELIQLTKESLERFEGVSLVRVALHQLNTAVYHDDYSDSAILTQVGQVWEAHKTNTDSQVRIISTALFALMSIIRNDLEGVKKSLNVLEGSQACDKLDSESAAVVIEALYWIAESLFRCGEADFADDCVQTIKQVAYRTENNILNLLNARFGSSKAESQSQGEVLKRQSTLVSRLETEVSFWSAASKLHESNYQDAIVELERLRPEKAIGYELPESLMVAADLLILICVFELEKYDQLGARHSQLVLYIQRCKRLHEHELLFINSMRRVKVFDSLNAEQSFYQTIINRLAKADCQNRYLMFRGIPLTTSWLIARSERAT